MTQMIIKLTDKDQSTSPEESQRLADLYNKIMDSPLKEGNHPFLVTIKFEEGLPDYSTIVVDTNTKDAQKQVLNKMDELTRDLVFNYDACLII